MTPNDKLLIEELRRDEGVRYFPYKDTVGIDTVGVGHNLKAKPLDVRYPLTDEQVDSILAEDMIAVFHDLDGKLGWWRTLSYPRQRVMANMCFNLGIGGLLGFKNTLAHVKAGNFEEAAKGMLSSLWARQVGKRAERLARMMREG